jgi:hypothetical protein
MKLPIIITSVVAIDAIITIIVFGMSERASSLI